MINPYPVGNTVTLIDGGNIATGTIVSDALYSGTVEAKKIQADNLAAKAIQAEHLAVGPQFQFRTTAGGEQLLVNTDGSFSLPTSNRNPTDARWVADANHSYPASQLVKHFAATFKRPTLSSDHIGILFNLSDAYGASGLTGILVFVYNNGLFVHQVSGVGGFTQLATYTVSSTGLDRVAIQYYGSQSTPRMRVFFNGAEVGAGEFTDTFLGVSGGAQGGYTGFLLTNSNIKISDIIMGNQPTEIEDGAISTQHLQTSTIFANQAVISSVIGGINAGSTTIDGGKLTTGTVVADSARVGAISTDMLDANAVTAEKLAANSVTAAKLSADLAITDVVRSSQYTPGALGVVPVGFKLSGTPFTTTYTDGATDATCQMEIGGNINIAGAKAAGVANSALGGTIEYNVPGNYTWVCPEGVTRINIILQGGGGGGSVGVAGSHGGGGGSGGCHLQITGLAVVPGESYPLVVGAGGHGGTASLPDGGLGASSTIYIRGALRGADGGYSGWADGRGGANWNISLADPYTAPVGAPGAAGKNGGVWVLGSKEGIAEYYECKFIYGGGGGGGCTSTSTSLKAALGGLCFVYLPDAYSGILYGDLNGASATNGTNGFRVGGCGGNSFNSTGGYAVPSETVHAGSYGSGGAGGAASSSVGVPGGAGGDGFIRIWW